MAAALGRAFLVLLGYVTSPPPVLILGGGLTGLSAALHVRRKPVRLVEREQRVGGHARSRRRDGFTFDITGHWLHVRDARVHQLIDALFDADEWITVDRRTRVYSHNTLLPYPFQANLFGLPREVVHECLTGFFTAHTAAQRDSTPPRTFAAFVESRFGAGISRHFFVPYNTKLWGMHPDGLTPDWVTRYVPVPNADQVIAGAIGLPQEGLGYNAQFRYPRAGGIDHLPNRIYRELTTRRGRGQPVRIDLATDVEEIDPTNRRIKLDRDPNWIAYERLISTIPLPELIRRIPTAPSSVVAAANALRWVRWRWLDIATNRPPRADYHWVYVPEPELPFFRVGIYSNACPQMAPPGGASLYVELSDRDAVPSEPAVIRALCAMNVLRSPEDVVFCEPRSVEYAYVVFDDAWADATRTIFAWLERVGIHSCGRYGAWIYNAMQDCLLAGIEAAAWAETDAT
ncbi:MAG: hypothetical protein B7733_14310 [Myxococcales bacterium FL481]|nr:MAG: hypothetical protein B7733_14310 [Myxococcales bacterium FL481]